MATQKKTAEVDYSMQEKILALYDLQKIDSQIDSINKVKGELPLEVQDLDDELAGLKARVENINAEIEELNALSKQRKREVDQAKILIGNYKEQQNNVRNNREFDAISKEIEYQELEIELAEKRLKEYAAGIKVKKAQVEETEALMTERRKDLEAKQTELQSIEAGKRMVVMIFSSGKGNKGSKVVTGSSCRVESSLSNRSRMALKSRLFRPESFLERQTSQHPQSSVFFSPK